MDWLKAQQRIDASTPRRRLVTALSATVVSIFAVSVLGTALVSVVQSSPKLVHRNDLCLGCVSPRLVLGTVTAVNGNDVVVAEANGHGKSTLVLKSDTLYNPGTWVTDNVVHLGDLVNAQVQLESGRLVANAIFVNAGALTGPILEVDGLLPPLRLRVQPQQHSPFASLNESGQDVLVDPRTNTTNLEGSRPFELAGERPLQLIPGQVIEVQGIMARDGTLQATLLQID